MRIYFAHSFEGTKGPPVKLSDEPGLSQFIHRLRKRNIEIIDPAEVKVPPNFPLERFRHCLMEIASADVLLVVAQYRLGVGVGAEMMYAHIHRTRVFVVCPTDSYYRSSCEGEEIVHAFVHSLSTEMFNNLDDCASAIEELCA